MTDGQYLLLLFVALYLIECVRWLPPRSQMLTGSGSHWRGHRPFQPITLGGRSPALLSFLPPLQVHLVTLPWQLIPAAEGLEVNLDDRHPHLLPWEEVKPRVEGRTLHLSPRLPVRCLSEAHALQAQQQVQQWMTFSQEEREASFLASAHQSLQAGPITDLAASLSSRTRALRHLGSFIFVWTFMVIVALYRWLGEGVAVLWAAGALLLWQLTQAILFYRRSQGIPWRFWKTLAIALLPQQAMRAADHFADAAVSLPSHPLAPRALLGDAAWRLLAKRYWKQARYRSGSTAVLQSRILEDYLEKEGYPVSEIDAPPAPQLGSVSYCPSCQAQFQAGAALCKDCGGVELRPF
ncbi:hypothetical protein EI77_03834 [Prosthecobacter fusiformis]|uniref:Uncharacterized protein n=1 Tax=Prosthecobacter fusiformis TaxID=48464 RepID=A0A4R7RPC2_9BACT|nr:hypothetical protein [Prosthecobacter fusiformis]TDU66097.1 hypothetical protein EI77_03834 [Prosthecobacter fusiformis]